MLRLIRIAASWPQPDRLYFSGHCRMLLGESEMNRSVVALASMAVKCAAVSRWACRKRRRKNSPCMRQDALVMAGMKDMLRLLAYCERYALIFLRAETTCSSPSGSWGWVRRPLWWVAKCILSVSWSPLLSSPRPPLHNSVCYLVREDLPWQGRPPVTEGALPRNGLLLAFPSLSCDSMGLLFPSLIIE